jgi:hypothetical protein
VVNATSGADPGTDAFTLQLTIGAANNKGWQSSYDFINHEKHVPYLIMYLNKQTDSVNTIVVDSAAFDFCEVNAANGDDTYCFLRLDDDDVSAWTTDSGKTYKIHPYKIFDIHFDFASFSSSGADSRLYFTSVMGDAQYWKEHGKSSTAFGTNTVDIDADFYYLLDE